MQKSIIFASCIGITVISLVIAGVCLIPYWNDLRYDGQRQLQFSFHARRMAVEAYFSNLHNVAAQISRRTHVRHKLAAYASGHDITRQELIDFVRPVYKDALTDQPDLRGITLLDSAGELVVEMGLRAPIAWQPPSLPQETLLQGPLPLGDQVYITLETPITVPPGVPVGFTRAIFQVERLQQILADATGLGKTGQTLLGRWHPDPPTLFFPCRPTPGADPQSTCLADLQEIFRQAGKRANGVAFLDQGREMVAYGPVVGTPFGMATRIFQAELYANIYRRLPLVGLVILGFIVTGVYGMAVLLRPLTGKIILHHEDLLREIDTKTTELHQELQLRQATAAKLQDSETRLRTLTTQLMRTQENERRRISRELHDEFGQTLTACKLQLAALQKKLSHPREARHTCYQLEAMLDSLMTNIHRLCYDLNPSVLEELGLDAALRHLVAAMSIPGTLQVKADMAPMTGFFSPEAEMNIYRLIQEALNNIGKHADASKVSLHVAHAGNAVTITIQDDGDGFEPQAALTNSSGRDGMGLTSMLERARLLGGSLSVHSQPGAGTCLLLTVPLQKEH